MLPGEGNLAQRQRGGKRVSNNWRTRGWEPVVTRAGRKELKSQDWFPRISCHRIWEGRIRCLARDLVVPSPPPASGTAGDWGQPDAPSGTLLGQARAHTPLSLLALPLSASLSLDRPLLPSLSTDSLRVLCLLPPALKRSPLSDAPNLELLLDGRTVAASAGSVPSGLRLQPTPASFLATTRAPWTFDPRR